MSIPASKLLACFSRSRARDSKFDTRPFRPAIFASLDVTRLSRFSNLSFSVFNSSRKPFNVLSNSFLLSTDAFCNSCLAVLIFSCNSSTALARSATSSLMSLSTVFIFASSSPTRSLSVLASFSIVSIDILIFSIDFSLVSTRFVSSSSLEDSFSNLLDKLVNLSSSSCLLAATFVSSFCLVSSI